MHPRTLILAALRKSKKPLTAYDLLAQLKPKGIKAAPTIYRALQALQGAGLIHRIESLGAFVACHSDVADHGSQFAVCRSCGTVEELHDHGLGETIAALGTRLQFRIEREMLELIGLCQQCDARKAP